MHIVSVSMDGANVVLVHSGEHAAARSFVRAQESETATEDPGPSPIAPEAKELLWGLGAFLVMLILMRLILVPKVQQGMRDRYGKVRTDLETAEAMRDAARTEVAEYEAQLAAVRAEARERIDAARMQLDRERFDQVAEANEAIAVRRSRAATDAEAARLAARGSVDEAAMAVAGRLVELSTGRRPADGDVRAVVADLVNTGAPS